MRRLEGGAAVADNARITGEVELAADASVWFGVVIRGDDAPIEVGPRTNVQDLTMIHADPDAPNRIGAEVTIGHGCVLHGVRVGDRSLIGMKAVLLGGSVVGEECIVAAGSVVKEGFEVPDRHLVAGVPARIVRELRPDELGALRASADGYVKKIQLYLPLEGGEL
jgi:carbonic anhydrase/acetyltransferase-like protein (isoleucine patch superfamily)